MGSILREKGWEKTFWMQLMVVVVYLGSLFFGSIAYTVYVGITQGMEAVEELGLVLYLASYIGVLIGVGGLFLSTKLIKDRNEPTDLVKELGA